MTEDFAELDALLRETKQASKGVKKGDLLHHRFVPKEPDALVLGMVRTTCSCCGSVTEYPSSHLLLRFGRDYKWSAHTVATSPHNCPLEVKYVEIANANCLHCFPDAPRAPDSSRMWQHGMKLNCEPAELR